MAKLLCNFKRANPLGIFILRTSSTKQKKKMYMYQRVPYGRGYIITAQQHKNEHDFFVISMRVFCVSLSLSFKRVLGRHFRAMFSKRFDTFFLQV